MKFFLRQMNRTPEKITGILLAGGMSSRMGREKGMLKLGNLYLYEYPLKVLEACCDDILISTCKEDAIPVDYPRICDEVKGIGPMGGMYTCLKHSTTDLNIILSYDMPGVNTPLIRFLLEEGKSFDISVPALTADQPEPLCGIYRKNALAVFETCIRQDEFAVHRALKMAHAKVVRIDESMSFWSPQLFLNINRMEDLDKLNPGFGGVSNED